jgi:HSP20 family protein
MLVRYWQPWREIESFRRQFDQVFDTLAQTTGDTPTWTPAIELQDTGDAIALKAQLPGIDAKDVNIQVTKDAVVLSGERQTENKIEENGYFRSEFRYGKFQRVISLPVQIQNQEVKADYKDGILHLTLPKAETAQVVKLNLAELAQNAENN